MEEILHGKLKNKTITFLIDPCVPHFINSDELRIQQLLIAVCDGIHELYNVNNNDIYLKASIFQDEQRQNKLIEAHSVWKVQKK